MKLIVLDPGHGDTRGAPGYDSGVVYGDRHEADANLEMCGAMQFLARDKFRTLPTRDGTAGAKPDLNNRVLFAKQNGADAFVSLHFNSVGAGDLVYFAPGKASLEMARVVAQAMGISRVVPSSSSRFNGLYIDAFPDSKPSILIEFAGIELAPKQGVAGKAARIAFAEKAIAGFQAYFNVD